MVERRKCLECGVTVNVENLPAHFAKLHPRSKLDPSLLQEAQKEARARRTRRAPSPSEKRVYVISAVVILVVLAAAIGIQQLSRPPSPTGVAPDFALTTTSGSTLRLSALRGNVVLIDFFSTSCGACREFTPDTLVPLYAQHGSHFVLVSIDVNAERDALEAGNFRITSFMSTYGATWTYALDVDQGVTRAYGVSGTPTHFIIDKDGNIADQHTGKEPLDQLVARLSRYF